MRRNDLRSNRNSWIIMLSMTIGLGCQDPKTPQNGVWRQLPQVPDAVGFAGAYAGVSNGHLLLAGGANFPEGTRPWSGGVKQWNDKVFALSEGEKEWKEVGRLPRPMGYGVSVSSGDRLVILGGADQNRHFQDVYTLRYEDGKLTVDRLPDMPAPLANACGSVLNNVLYIAGGLTNPTDTTATSTFWALDLKQPQEDWKWEVLSAWPGSPRMLSVAGSAGNAFYLISGVALHTSAGGSVARREYLTDAYRYRPGNGWERLPDLPHAVAAAPSPALTVPTGELRVFGGDDGALASQVGALKDRHPGFRNEILGYNPETNAWEQAGVLPVNKRGDPENDPNASTWAPVTTTAVNWSGWYVLPMGEVRPGVRTNRVLLASISDK